MVHDTKTYTRKVLKVLQSQGDCYLAKALHTKKLFIVQELCESRGGRPGLSVLTSLLVSVDVKLY